MADPEILEHVACRIVPEPDHVAQVLVKPLAARTSVGTNAATSETTTAVNRVFITEAKPAHLRAHVLYEGSEVSTKGAEESEDWTTWKRTIG
jgi:hypothetical protein